MKKLIYISFMVLAAVFSLTACGKKQVEVKKNKPSASGQVSHAASDGIFEPDEKIDKLNDTITLALDLGKTKQQPERRQNQQRGEKKQDKQQTEQGSTTIIDNGQKQYVTKQSTQRELDDALSYLHYYCKCEDVKKRFPTFFKEYKYGYGNSKKEELISKFGDVIEFIESEYKKPIYDLSQKIIIVNKMPISSCDCDMKRFKELQCTCFWHNLLLAQRGLAAAQYIEGSQIMRRRKGSVSQKELDTYIRWLLLAANGGILDAYSVLGNVFYTLGDYKNAFGFWNTGIEKRNLNCIIDAANVYFYTVRDSATALSLYRLAADQGHYYAIRSCADIYSGLKEGRNTTAHKNPDLAIKYYKQLIELTKQNKCRYGGLHHNEESIAFWEKEITKLKQEK